MGLFNFFGRKPPKTPEAHLAEPALDRPRCHHYTLAHVALRSVALEQPVAFLGMLASPEAPRFLADLMRSVSEHCKKHEPQPDFRIEDITIHKVRIDNYPCAAIEMPRPRAMTEAYFVAAVLLNDLEEELPNPQEAPLRYFTLEKGLVFDDPPRDRTVLCEWTRDGTHLNYGDGPEPRLEALIEAVRKLLPPSP